MSQTRIFVSELHDPCTNLAIENHLLKSIQAPSLFLYQNAPCVVMGRAQNPWLEMDVSFLTQQGIPILRRQSGGGTVVHDLGNLNFSFLAPKAAFEKNANIQLVADTLTKLSLPVKVAERCDLLLNDKKISGSAFRETKDNCFHHGTLLINSDLSFLRRCLQAPELGISTKAIPSRRSSVINLCDAAPDLNVTTVIDALINCFAKHHQLNTAHVLHFKTPQPEWDITATQAQYQSESWIFKHTLPFSAEIKTPKQMIRVEVEQGEIIAITPNLNEYTHLIGKAYHEVQASPLPLSER